jgi:uncharacterized protein YdeI (YjbR/CyaY-like superfamily)
MWTRHFRYAFPMPRKPETTTSETKPLILPSASAFRAWLAKNQDRVQVLWLGIYNQRTPKKSVRYSEAVDEALCFGWIDGVRKSVNAYTYTVRFTPRKPQSNWSAVNLRRVEALIKRGRMTPPGIAAFEGRATKRDYSYEQQRATALSTPFEKRFKSDPKAWQFYQAQAAWYRRTSSFWVMSAKQETTRERRLATLIADSAAGRRLGVLTPKARKIAE